MRTNKEVKRKSNNVATPPPRGVELAILVALILGLIAFLIVWNHYQPERERAAYNEGRYGVNHKTALVMAHAGIGKTAEDVLEGK